MKFEVVQYNRQRALFERKIDQFRRQILAEGADNLSYEKYDVDYHDLETWMVFADNKLISISAVESSHYTGDAHIAARICRHHTLKEYRHLPCGLLMIEPQLAWARGQGFQVIYLTCDIHNDALNAVFQRKVPIANNLIKDWESSEWHQNLSLEPGFLFRVSQDSDFLQYVYSMRLEDPDFQWTPKKNIVFINHEGRAPAELERRPGLL